MSIPANFFATISSVIAQYGEEVTYYPFDGGPSVALRASVQAPLEETLVADQEQEGFIVFIAREALSAMPQKFDRLTIRGRDRTVEDVIETKIVNETVCYTVRVVG